MSMHLDSTEIRLASRGDALKIAGLSRDLIETGLIWSWTPTRIIRELRARNANVVVATRQSRVLGFGIMRYHAHHARLNLFAVERASQRQGVGSRLLGWLERTAQVNGSDAILLEVREQNVNARRFYQRHGFVERQRLAGYYQGLESAILMAKPLGEELISPAPPWTPPQPDEQA